MVRGLVPRHPNRFLIVRFSAFGSEILQSDFRNVSASSTDRSLKTPIRLFRTVKMAFYHISFRKIDEQVSDAIRSISIFKALLHFS